MEKSHILAVTEIIDNEGFEVSGFSSIMVGNKVIYRTVNQFNKDLEFSHISFIKDFLAPLDFRNGVINVNNLFVIEKGNPLIVDQDFIDLYKIKTIKVKNVDGTTVDQILCEGDKILVDEDDGFCKTFGVLSISLSEKAKSRNFNNKPDNKRISEFLIAERFGCAVGEAKYKFLQNMKAFDISLSEKEKIILILHSREINESLLLDMKINDTPSAILKTWALEYFNGIVEKKVKYPELPENLKKGHKKNVHKNMLIEMLSRHKNGTSPEINDEIIERCRFLAVDEISRLIHLINGAFINNDKKYDNYSYLLGKSIKFVKEIYLLLLRIYPNWFILAYPDVAIWSLKVLENEILPVEIKNKIKNSENQTEYDKINEWMKREFYEVSDINNNTLTFDDLRLIVDLYKKNNELECIGIDD